MKFVILSLAVLLTSCSKSNNSQIEVPLQETELERSLEASASSVMNPSGSSVVESVIQVPFGTILNTESKSLRATIRNNSTAGETIVSVTRVASAENYFVQTSSNCNNVKPKSTCDIRMSFNGKASPQNEGGSFSGQWILTFSDNTTQTIQMNITVEVPAPPTQEEIDAQAAAQIDNVTFTPSGSIDFGEITDKESKTVSIQIRNNNSSPITFVTSVQQPFTLITGCSTISAKSSCTTRVSLNGAGKEGQQLSSFSYGTKSTPLSAFVKTTAQVIQETPLVENILESSELLDFGSLKPSDTSIKQVTFTNKSNLPVTLQTNLSNPEFSIISNSCNNAQVAVNSSCSVRVSLSGSGKSEGPMTGTLIYGTTGLVNLSANILSEAELEQIALEQAQVNSNIVMTYGTTTYGTTTYSHQQTLDLGIKNQGVVEQLTFNLKNTGTAPASVSQVSFASNLTIVSNSCNTTLSPNASCQIRASLNPQSQSPLNLSANLGFEVRTFPIAYTLAGPNVACTPENALNNGVTDMSGVVSVSGNLPNCVVASCNETSHTLLGLNQSRCGAISYQPVYGNYGTCDAPVCGGLASGSQSRTYACNRLIDGLNPNPVSESFCSSLVSDLSISCDSPAGTVENIITGGTQTLSCSAGSTVQNFQSVSCNNGFEQIGNECGEVSYQPVYSSYSTCSAQACEIAGTQSRTYTCNKLINGSNPTPVENSFCSSLVSDLEVSCPSPEGDVMQSITGGSQTYTCLEGSSAQIFKSVECTVSGYEANGQICSAVSYQPTYSSTYTGCTTTTACSGQSLESASIESCQKLLDGQPVSGGHLSDCSSFDQSFSRTCSSPSGLLIDEILGGTLNYNCGVGETITNITPTIICDSGYTADQLNLLCEENIVVPLEPRFGENFGGFNGEVLVSAKQSDGKYIFAGSFTKYNHIASNRIIRFNSDGSLDTSFNIGQGLNGSVNAIAIQNDGKILVGGGFTSYNGTTRNRIARINIDGTLDETFNPGSGTMVGTNAGIVYALAVENNGDILIGGAFTSYNGTTANRIVKVSSSGSHYVGHFSNGAGGTVYSIKIQSDNKILVGGAFTTFNLINRNRIARLNLDGTLDSNFPQNNTLNGIGTAANSQINKIDIQSDGKIIIAGNFSSYNGTTRGRIARINNDGSIDTSFSHVSGANTSIVTFKIQNDGKILIGGNFLSYDGISNFRIARINSSGSLDNSFLSGTGFGQIVNTIEIKDNGGFLIGGDFNSYNEVAKNKICSIGISGDLDLDFNSNNFNGANDTINDVAIQVDGKVVVVGNFTLYNGVSKNRIARINSDGSLDESFNLGIGANNSILSVDIQDDGKILIGGAFTSYNGASKNYIVRLNSDGSIDPDFDIGTGSSHQIHVLKLQDDGKILIGGGFFSYNGTNRNRIARLNSNGSIDLSFNPGGGAGASAGSGTVTSMDIQNDGKIIIGGTFNTYNGIGRNRIARININGSLDESFNPGTGASTTGGAGSVNSVRIKSDGKIVASGLFNLYNGLTRNGIVLIHTDGSVDEGFQSGTGLGTTGNGLDIAFDEDGSIIVVGSFSSYNGTTLNRIVKINEYGTMIQSFNQMGADNSISKIKNQNDGKLILVGAFRSYNDFLFDRIVRIMSNGTLE